MEVAATHRPELALQWLRDGKAFDLALLDTALNKIEDVQPAHLFNQVRPNLPLVLMAAGAGGSGDLPKLQKPFKAVISKPFHQKQFPHMLLEALDLAPLRVNRFLPGEQAETSMGKLFPLRILVAEDNPINQRIACRMLEKLAYRADLSGNGVEVIEALDRERYDVVCMDVQMPEMDGLSATRAIVDNRSPEARPFILGMTANALQGDREKCIQAGMDDYLCKPVRLENIKGALLRRQRHHAPLYGRNSDKASS